MFVNEFEFSPVGEVVFRRVDDERSWTKRDGEVKLVRQNESRICCDKPIIEPFFAAGRAKKPSLSFFKPALFPVVASIALIGTSSN